MNFFTDFKAINKVVFKKTNGAYVKSLVLIPLLGVYVFVYFLVDVLLGFTLGSLGSVGSYTANIITWLFSACLISDYLNLLERAISGYKFSFSEVGKNYTRYFLQTLSAIAIPNIIVYLLWRLTGIQIPYFIILLFYSLYAIPEIVYQKHYDRLEIFAYGHNFFKENYKFWLLLNFILGLVIVGITILVSMTLGTLIMGLLVSLPIYINLVIVPSVTMMIVAIPLVYCLLYRGYVFKILSVSSRRKREYMRNIYGE